MHITTDMLERLYELLRVTPPFKRWKLPDADDLEFRATRLSDNAQGEFRVRNNLYILTVNPDRHHTLASAMLTLAHEMVHLRDQQLGVKASHGASFKRMADQVCQHHGFDRGQF